MNEIKKIDSYTGQIVSQSMMPDNEQPNVLLYYLRIIRRQWRPVLMIAMILFLITVPFVWIAGKDYFDTEGAIRVTPLVSPILFRDLETDRPVPNYEHFVNTQASLMASNNVINRVADQLKDKKLVLFDDVDDLSIALKVAVKRQDILIEPIRLTELVKLSMKTSHPDEAEMILNTFLKAYMSIIATEEVRGGDQKLALLEDKKKTISDQIDRQQEEIRSLAEEYGTVVLSSRQDMMLQQVVSLQNELTSIEVQRLSFEASVNMKKGGIDGSLRPAEYMQMRNEFLNADLVLQQLSTDLAEQETLVVEMQQVMSSENSRLIQQKQVLESLKNSLQERRRQMLKMFDQEFDSAMSQNQSLRLVDLNAELKKTIEYENRIRRRLEKANAETVRMGRKQLAINNLQEKLDRVKQTYDAVNRRIDELQIERQRQTRVSVAYMASSVPAIDKKLRYTGVILIISLAIGCSVVIVIEKYDTSVKSPEEISNNLGLRIIGTTTSPLNIDKIMLGRQLTDDYQTIRANLALVDEQSTKKILVISSAGVGDGKTTFAVNLATSFAKSGEKTLLIDGDLRKPDIAVTLNLSKNLRGLQEVLLEGIEYHRAVFRMPSTGLHVLASDHSNTSDALDLLGQSSTAEKVMNIAEYYDHVIIDTPPILAFTDALLWAKISDGVILTSYVDRTSSDDVKKTIQRLRDIDVEIIGTVVNNVQGNQRYNRYGYGYDFYGYQDSEIETHRDAALLLSTEDLEDDYHNKQ